MDWEMTLRNEYEKGRERERVHTEDNESVQMQQKSVQPKRKKKFAG